MAAALWAMRAGPLVNTGTMAVPSRIDGAHCDVRASGVKASVPSVSADHASVYPAAASSSIHSRWSCNGTRSTGMVMP